MKNICKKVDIYLTSEKKSCLLPNNINVYLIVIVIKLFNQFKIL